LDVYVYKREVNSGLFEHNGVLGRYREKTDKREERGKRREGELDTTEKVRRYGGVLEYQGTTRIEGNSLDLA
jgi:hypothetical protein